MLPADVTVVTVTGTYTNEDGLPVSGSLTFIPSVATLRDPAHDTIIKLRQTRIDLDVTGSFSLSLIATDDPDVIPVGWHYDVTERIEGHPQRTWILQLHYTLVTIDIADVPSTVDPSLPVYPAPVCAVTSVVGETGDVTGAEILADATIAAALATKADDSDLDALVPYTGATGDLDLGAESLYAANVSYGEGLLADPTITDAAGVAISITSVDVLIRDDANFGATQRLYRATVPAVAALAMTDNALNYVYVDWNGGSPVYAATTNRDLLNHSNRVPAARVYMDSGSIEYQLTYGALARGAAVRNVDRIYRIRGTAGSERESGLAVSESATRVVTIASGYAWTGLRRIALDAVTQGGAGVTSHLWYHTAGTWAETTITQYNNTQYDNGTNLVTLTANRYAVNWIYRSLVGPEIDIVLGSGDYTLAQAEASGQPAIPPAILGFYILVGRIIVQRNASTAIAIESVVDTTFNQSAVSSHNDLSNLQGGAPGEYYHLTSAQQAALGVATSITAGTPTGGGTGTAGQILYDAGYLYVCTATNTWKRVQLNTF
jgi:hypothetical protein